MLPLLVTLNLCLPQMGPRDRRGQQHSVAALGKLVLLRDALERLVDRLDAIEKSLPSAGSRRRTLYRLAESAPLSRPGL
jgi:hypothetical protein